MPGDVRDFVSNGVEMATMYREATRHELDLLEKLCGHARTYKDELLDQISNCKVRTLDENGSLEINVLSNKRADVKLGVAVEGEAPDSDGFMIHYLLHVRD